jgi:hypothetical protein
MSRRLSGDGHVAVTGERKIHKGFRRVGERKGAGDLNGTSSSGDQGVDGNIKMENKEKMGGYEKD